MGRFSAYLFLSSLHIIFVVLLTVLEGLILQFVGFFCDLFIFELRSLLQQGFSYRVYVNTK